MKAKLIEVIMTDDGSRNTYHSPHGKLLFQVPDPNVTEVNKIVAYLTSTHNGRLVKGEPVGDAVIRVCEILAHEADVAKHNAIKEKNPKKVKRPITKEEQ